MLWKKDPNMHYTDMCIYIDKNVPVIANPGQNKEVENTVYNYLWLLVKALAIKYHMFTNFKDYDGYAFHSASRLFFALRNNYNNQGKVIKGKTIKPIKSCLNYTKTLLYPMKVEYQNETYNVVISEENVSKQFDSLKYRNTLKDNAMQYQIDTKFTDEYIRDAIKSCAVGLEKTLEASPFQKDSIDYYRLKISILLTCAKCLKNTGTLNITNQSVVLWKLPKSISNYVNILVKEFIINIKQELLDCLSATSMDDALLEKVIAEPTGDYIDHEN